MEKAFTLREPCLFNLKFPNSGLLKGFIFYEQSGLGELLNAKNMYDSNYHSLALDLRPICRVCSSIYLKNNKAVHLTTLYY